MLWNKPLLILHIASDAAIAIAYFIIGGSLVYFTRKRSDLAFARIIWMFGTFIAACAFTHVFDILTIFTPVFWLQGVVKLFTAAISMTTAIMLIPIIPKALSMRNPEELDALNQLLQKSVQEKDELLNLYSRERRVANEFQTASLPHALPNIPGLTFSSMYNSGSSEMTIGGDWYDAMRLIDGRIIISIGDVAGSGLKAAVVMNNIRQVLRGVAQLHPDPVLMLDAADRTLRADHEDTLVTAFVAVLDPVSMNMTYASAGHPAPILINPAGEIHELGYRGMILGLRQYDDTPSQMMDLQFGSTLVFYTDGLIEAKHDVAIGEALLMQSLKEVQNCDPRGLANSILDIVLDEDARDDVAILTLHIEDRQDTLSRYRFQSIDAEAARQTRLAFVAGLKKGEFTESALYTAELVFGELLGNIVRYAPGEVEIIIDWSGVIPVLHMLDNGPGFWYIPKLPADLLSESGRGLFLVKELTTDFTISKRRGGGSHARAVISTQGITQDITQYMSDIA